jgi:hypothetical protein
MLGSAQFFCTAWSQTTNVSAFVTAIKELYSKKKTVKGSLAYRMAVK